MTETAMLRKFQVITPCPIHEGKNVYLIVDAPSSEEAERRVLGRTVSCPWGPVDTEPHDFTVETVLGVMPFPWKPPKTVSTSPISSTEVKEFTTSDLGERFWILSRKGQREFGEIEKGVRAVTTLVPVKTGSSESRGLTTVAGVGIILLLLLVASYYLYKKFKT